MKEVSREEQLAPITIIMIPMVTLVLVNDASGRGKAEEAERRKGSGAECQATRNVPQPPFGAYPYQKNLACECIGI